MTASTTNPPASGDDADQAAPNHASRVADRELDEQRRANEPRDDLPKPELVEEGVGTLVNNTGLDGDAASG